MAHRPNWVPENHSFSLMSEAEAVITSAANCFVTCSIIGWIKLVSEQQWP